ncbi:MAG: DUF362 domain-containing protein [Armatimonadota bacterium]|nr:DUF362 domain-containing protein [Armatimonadota bacterium]
MGRRLRRLLLPVLGLLSIIWFLVRVIPKPSRAAYPCQRVAAPMASGFVIWLAGLIGSAWAYQRGKRFLRESRAWKAVLCSVVLAVGGLVAVSNIPRPASSDVSHGPIGVAKGIHPGRVVWVHNPAVTDWQGPGYGHWWESSHTDQTEVDTMMSRAVRGLTGAGDDAAAWDALFRYFNQTHDRGDVGYQPGEKIAIKVNLVGCIDSGGSGAVDPNTYDLVSNMDYMNTSPQVMLALLRQLVNVAGVNQADISIGDPVCLFPNQYYNLLHDEFPNVKYLDNRGYFNRTKPLPSAVDFYFSARPTGVTQDKVLAPFAEATYFINLANLKSHSSAGVTLCAKNYYGFLRLPLQGGYYNLHNTLPANVPGMGYYRPVVDMMGHAHTGGKALLYLIDGLYAGVHPTENSPRKWNSSPFNGYWTSSLFASQDPVAIDSVGYDFLYNEWSDYPHISGAEDYLHEAAFADNPPSGTFYDPDHDTNTTRLSSLGVHEHWNDPVHRQYSRNLGLNQGIELVSLNYNGAVREAKLKDNGANTIVPGVAVTAAFLDSFYIESDDRASGMRVQMPGHGLAAGSRANVRGLVQTDLTNDERFIAATSASNAGVGAVRPVGMNSRALGGGDWNYNPSAMTGQRGVTGASGLNNIGLLVSIWGRFAYLDSSTFTVDDGGGPVKCVVPPSVTLDPAWSFVRVTGASSCEKDGDNLVRLIRVRDVETDTRTISENAFDSDEQGWSIYTWASGPYNPGTMVWESGAMRCSGAGGSDNSDTCTREGGEIYKTISTAGYRNIKVSYDLRVNSLGNTPNGPAGDCTVDHDLIDEQLTVFYSTNGGSTWTEAEYLTRSALLADYQTYATRTLDLSGISACNDNPAFALRFRWQVNNPNDAADLDNVRVTGN